MQCIPKKTLRLLIEGGNDYVVSVKANQRKLYQQLRAIAEHRKPTQPSVTEYRKQRGRIEQRIVRVFSADGINAKQWPQLKSIVCVERQRTYRGKSSVHRAYYISSIKTTTAGWAELIAGHWRIENRLHWPKDVLLKEDDTYGREANALLTASVFRTITINLLRLNGFNSIAAGLRELANQVERIFRLLQ